MPGRQNMLTLSEIGQYELSYRHLHGTPPPAEEINRTVLEAFRRYRTQGAASGIDPYLLMTHIADALHRRRDPAYFGEPLRWYARTLQHWVTLVENGTFPTLPARDRREIARHLLRADLYPFTPNSPHLKTFLRTLL